jgi:hypothetical protein
MKVADNKLLPLPGKTKKEKWPCANNQVDDVPTKWSSCNGWTFALIHLDIDGLVCGLPTQTETVDEQLQTRFIQQISTNH